MSQEEKYTDYNLLLNEILTSSGNTINFLKKYGYLYHFWYDLLLHNKSLNKIKSEQINFLEDLINSGRFGVYSNLLKSKKGLKNEAEDIFLLLLGNPNNTPRDILYLKDYKDQYYLNLRSLFDLWQEIYKEMSNKELIKMIAKRVLQKEQN